LQDDRGAGLERDDALWTMVGSHGI